jgi:hypothetical protein
VESGITWKVNADGSVTATGTATKISYFVLSAYTDYGSTTVDAYGVEAARGNGKTFSGDVFWNAANKYLSLQVLPSEGYVNKTFYPMVNEGDTALPYEPFEGYEPWYPLGDERLLLTNEGRLAVAPVVEVQGEVTLKVGNTSRAMSTGTYLLPELYLTPGEHLVQCSGTGLAKITYREAVLAG